MANVAPTCYGDTQSQRSDGRTPVTFNLHPYCADADGDAFTLYGSGPGDSLKSPESVPAGGEESNWYYRTKTLAGTETAKLWAIDSHGARSDDVTLTVTVGPGVDTPPTCTFDGWTMLDGLPTIFTRPGAVRRFGIRCRDAESDYFAPRLVADGKHGHVSIVDVPGPDIFYDGAAVTMTATYTPADDTGHDTFSVVADGAKGSGPVAELAIVTTALPGNNASGGCGGGGSFIKTDTPGVATYSCDDNEGDPLSAAVITPPAHGVAGTPTTAPGDASQQTISVPYTPDPGYRGADRLGARVSDGHGFSMDITIPLTVTDTPPTYVAGHGHWPTVSSGLTPGRYDAVPVTTAPAKQAAALTSAQVKALVRAAAAAALGTKQLRAVSSAPGTYVYAPVSLSKRALLRGGRGVKALFVLCTKQCRVRSDTRFAARGAHHRATAGVAAGKSTVVWSGRLSARERSALKTAKRPRASFDVSITPSGAKAKRLRESIKIAR